MKQYIAINGILVTINLLSLGCLMADLGGVNLLHLGGSQIRIQGLLAWSEVKKWAGE